MRIIIDWERREIYKEEEFSELIDSMVECGAINDFESYLTNNYYMEDVFNFTEAERVGVRTEYEEYQRNEVERAINSYDEYAVIEINSENKVNIKN